MKSPICPVCGDLLEYDEQLDTHYENDGIHTQWRGNCPHCQAIYKWWENYSLISITDMELDELE